ncbi:probable galacturonosyltransferase 7 isoform X1 [Olea europaea subsp. europaea]|uniref:Hexosyltransferase n=1 Tax=Olea europaea subsp. europaea TaxID=158383 RepID=A0A8S0Q6D6_OLEEU|nr:probable galacturonosyltransferase 7 isoform X1 [Olea europaea subsp. europaea]
MKGGYGGSSYSLATKRRWKGLVTAVLGLVFLSMLVSLVFLLGLHNGFLSSAGYATEQPSSATKHLRVYDQHSSADTRNESKRQQSAHVDDLIKRLVPPLPKNSGVAVTDDAGKDFRGADESEKLCELKYGSYCLWRREHKEKMKDAVVKRMKDLLYVARAYYPSIAKLPAFDKLSHELKQNIQDFERVLSEATTDKDLPPQIEKKLTKMEAAIARAKSCPVDCNNVDKKLRQLVDLTEDEANFHRKQSAFLYQLAVQTMPKSLHCLSMRLTVEYFRSSLDLEQSLSEKVLNPELHHYVIFSRNLLASSVVINSTVQHTEESGKQVFHVLTDRENYFAMKFWFCINKYREATVQVLNIEDLKLNNHYKLAPLHLSLPEEFRVSFLRVDKLSSYQIKTEYLSIFSHSHYLLPKIFPTLKKVVVLDDDVLAQRDISDLWSLDMGGKVNGAVQFCTVKLGQLKKYLPRNSFSENSCAWMSGVNIIDLTRWREHNLTETFQRLVQEMSTEEGLSETTALSASMLTFRGLVYALDDSWMLSSLGLNYGHNEDALRTAAVLHFNGNMKPWLELGIPKYKSSWRKFLNLQNQFLSDCNVNP